MHAVEKVDDKKYRSVDNGSTKGTPKTEAGTLLKSEVKELKCYPLVMYQLLLDTMLAHTETWQLCMFSHYHISG